MAHYSVQKIIKTELSFSKEETELIYSMRNLVCGISNEIHQSKDVDNNLIDLLDTINCGLVDLLAYSKCNISL